MVTLNPFNRYLSRARGSAGTKPRPRRVHLGVEPLEARALLSDIPTPPIYQNPHMAPNNFSEIHFNAYQTDTTSADGPVSLASETAVQQGPISPMNGIAGTMAFTSTGQLVTIRAGQKSSTELYQTLELIDPVSLNVISSRALPPRAATGSVSFAGGGYFYLDNLDRVVCVTATQQIRIYSIVQTPRGYQFHRDQTYDLSAAIGDESDILNSVLPDSSGNLWFITKDARIGLVDPSGNITISSLRDAPGADPNETNTKSFATDENGGVFAVSDYALYRYQVGPDGSAQFSWRAPYDRGVRMKSGQNQQGSGTTPTLFNDFDGNQFVAITDNADPFLHVNVYRRQTGDLVAQQAVFSQQIYENSCENSLVAVNHSIIVENNYGNDSPFSTFGPYTTKPGLDRVDFDPRTHTATVAWDNNEIAIPSVVTQLSTGDGLIYTYAKDTSGWYFAAVDYDSGSIVRASLPVPWSNRLGGLFANNYYSGLGIGPDGSAYVGVFGGIVAWRPVDSGSGGSPGGAATSALAPDLSAVGKVNADGLPGLIADAGPGGWYVRAAGGPTRTAPADAVAFAAAFIGRDRVAAVEVAGDHRAEQALRTGPPALDRDFGTLRELDSVFTLDPSSWLGQ
jgi:hypothetical protein